MKSKKLFKNNPHFGRIQEKRKSIINYLMPTKVDYLQNKIL